MKFFLLASALVLGLSIGSAYAVSIEITSWSHGESTPVDGMFTDSGNFGSITGTYFGVPWYESGEAYFDFGTTGVTWAGSTADYDYTFDVNLTATQVAWGTYWDWSVSNDVPGLVVMDCPDTTIGTICTGYGITPYGPFSAGYDEHYGYIGVVSAVPVPASAWLFGSGLIGLVGLTRRKKA